jgi:hypothetical protein
MSRNKHLLRLSRCYIINKINERNYEQKLRLSCFCFWYYVSCLNYSLARNFELIFELILYPVKKSKIKNLSLKTTFVNKLKETL